MTHTENVFYLFLPYLNTQVNEGRSLLYVTVSRPTYFQPAESPAEFSDGPR